MGTPLFGSSIFSGKPPFNLRNTKVVKTPSDLLNIDSTKNYIIDGVIDMGSQPVIVPEGGISIAGLNGARDTAKLFSSEDGYTLFVSPDGGYSGDVVMQNCSFEITGASSKVFDLDNAGNGQALDIEGVNFLNCASIGELTDYRQLLFSVIGFISIDDGLTLSGAWTGAAVTTSLVVGFPAATLFKAGTAYTTSNFRSDMNFLSVNSASVFADFSESNITSDAGFRLTGFRSGADDAIPNIAATSVKCLFSECEGVRDTYAGGSVVCTVQATNTITTANTPVRLAGTFTSKELSSFTATAAGRLTYISSLNRSFAVTAIGNFSGGQNDTMNIIIRHYDSNDVLIETIDTQPATLNGGGGANQAESIVSTGFADVSIGDYFEVWIENTKNSSDIDTLVNTKLNIIKR